MLDAVECHNVMGSCFLSESGRGSFNDMAWHGNGTERYGTARHGIAWHGEEFWGVIDIIGLASASAQA